MKQVNIQIPEGYVIDTEKSNLEEGKIVFKKKEVAPWREYTHILTGYFVALNSDIVQINEQDRFFNDDTNKNVFATEKQAKSMLAMAQLSQIIQNDERFGGPITDKEWSDKRISKYCIVRDGNNICGATFMSSYHFLAFHTDEQYFLFLKENMDLINQYLMLD